jgi:SET domain-containing protein
MKKNGQGLKGSSIVWKKAGKKVRGVFTTRPIKKGELIEVAPVVPLKAKNVPDDEAPDGHVLNWDETSRNRKYAMGMGYVMLYNHSDKPNIRLESDLGNDVVEVTALRNIKAGEELVWDYGVEIWF